MTGPEMKTMFEGLVDDKLDDTLIYQLFNEAKFEIEMERAWEALKDVDSSQSIGTGHNYLTSKPLPTRFLTPLGLYVGTDRNPYDLIMFEERERFRDMSRRWYFKIADSTFYVCGTPTSGSVLNLFHTKSSADISATQDWTFPTIAHPLIPIKAAKLFYPIDRVEKGRAYDDRWKIQEDVCRRGLLMWDQRLKKMAGKRRYPFIPSTHSDIVSDY